MYKDVIVVFAIMYEYYSYCYDYSRLVTICV